MLCLRETGWDLRGYGMKRNDLAAFIREAYDVDADFPWLKHPNYAVFRHGGNKKWFAVIMDVPKSKLGLQGNDALEVVNFKCDPILLGSLLNEKGFFPAYHMNKASWVTVSLDGSVADGTIKMLLEMSFEATAPQIRKRKNGSIPG